MGRGLRVTIFNRDWDVCIDNPASLPIWMRDAARLLKGHVGQYVFISTISVYAANDKPADETAPLAAYKGADPMAETTKSRRADRRLYGPLKALSEKEARRGRAHYYPPEPDRGLGR